MFISPYGDPELGLWYIIRKIKGYPCYKKITSGSSEAHVKNFLIRGEIIVCSWYSSFSIFNYPMIYQICNLMMGAWDRVHFSVSHPDEIWEHDFSWVSWVVLLIWHYSNIYSGLKYVLFICKLENVLRG